MRKISVVAIFIFLVSSLPLTPSNAATPSAGKSCSKAGLNSTSNGVKLTCIKSGKNLVWAKSASSANKTPSKGAKFSAPIPITLPIAQSTDPNGITFANITTHISDIPATAYSKGEALISQNTLPVIPHDIFIAPALKALFSEQSVAAIIDRSIKYYSGFQQASYFAVYIYNNASTSWAEKTYQEVAKSRKYNSSKNYKDHYARDLQGTCSDGDCHSNNAGMIGGTNEGYLNVTVDNANHPFIPSGSLAHDYGHVIQSAQWDGTQIADVNDLKNKTYPGWLFQGGINQPAWTICTGSLREYLDARKQQGFNLRNSGFKNLSAQGITNYLLYSSTTESIDVKGNRISSSALPPNPMFEIGNSTGGLATEALVAISGPQSIIALHASMANGNSMDDAFQKVYGIAWRQAAAILGQVIAAEYAQTPPTPN